MCKADAVADLDGGNTLPTTPSGDQACEGYEGNWYEESTTGMCYQVCVTNNMTRGTRHDYDRCWRCC